MGIKRHKPEEIVTKLRQVEVLAGQGMARIDAIRQISIPEQAYYRWRKQYAAICASQRSSIQRYVPQRQDVLKKSYTVIKLESFNVAR